MNLPRMNVSRLKNEADTVQAWTTMFQAAAAVAALAATDP